LIFPNIESGAGLEARQEFSLHPAHPLGLVQIEILDVLPYFGEESSLAEGEDSGSGCSRNPSAPA
jgi:hypothetical protein